MDYLQDVHIAGRDYSGMAIAIIILSGIHVILSLVFSVMAYRKGLRKEGGAWLLSFGVCVAILVLAAVATGQKDNFSETKSSSFLKCQGYSTDDPHWNMVNTAKVNPGGGGKGGLLTFCCKNEKGDPVSCKSKENSGYIYSPHYDKYCIAEAQTQQFCPDSAGKMQQGLFKNFLPPCVGEGCGSADPSADNLRSSKCHTEGVSNSFQCNKGCEVISGCSCCDTLGGTWESCYDDPGSPCSNICGEAPSYLPSPPPCSPV